MAQKVTCSGCNAQFRLSDKAAGKTVKCRNCGTAIAVPHEISVVDDDVSAKTNVPTTSDEGRSDQSNSESNFSDQRSANQSGLSGALVRLFVLSSSAGIYFMASLVALTATMFYWQLWVLEFHPLRMKIQMCLFFIGFAGITLLVAKASERFLHGWFARMTAPFMFGAAVAFLSAELLDEKFRGLGFVVGIVLAEVAYLLFKSTPAKA